MKKIFENAIWWSGVVMVGLILGISLQFVRAWTEPTTAPPGGNIGAPINTSANPQTKAGGFTASSLKAGVIEGTTVKGTTQLCIGTDCRTAWPSGGGGGSPSLSGYCDTSSSVSSYILTSSSGSCRINRSSGGTAWGTGSIQELSPFEFYCTCNYPGWPANPLDYCCGTSSSCNCY